ncbi:MAG: ABC transporter substrate-binding protein [Candidatus Acidiferrales bacterium]
MPSVRSHAATRIVSLAPDVTSILFAIGAQKSLVGVSRWCKDVAAVGRLPRVGDCWALDVQGVAKLRPTMLIGSVPFKPDVVAELVKLPASFVALNPWSLANIAANIQLLGRLTNRSAAAGKLVAKMNTGFERIARAVRNSKHRPRVYCEAWPNPRISSPPWVAELVGIAGGEMVVAAGQRISDDDVVAAKPDVIVLAWTATRDRANPRKMLANPRFQNIPAVRDRRIVVIRDELLNTPGPPLVEGARELLHAIHPDLSK